jgi:hypothetical protein
MFFNFDVILENSFTMINFVASFLVIIEYGVGIDTKFQCQMGSHLNLNPCCGIKINY